MRILQVITIGHELYGAQKHVLDLSALLCEAGHEVQVAVGTEGPLTDALASCGIPYAVVDSLVRPIRPVTDFRSIGELKTLIRRFQPDLVASHSSKAGITSRMACRSLRIPNVFTAHGWSFEEGIPALKRNVFRRLERLAAKSGDPIIAVSNIGRAFAVEQGVASSNQVRTVYYGVADQSPYFQRQTSDVFTMTMVAGFRQQKDHATLIRALAGLEVEEPWQLYLLGDGDLRPTIERQVAAAGLADQVHFLGAVNVSNVPEYLSTTDLMVLTTNWEGLPISILEGLAFGLPVVASDVSGVREGVIHEYNGLLTERGNVEQVRSALHRLMTSPTQRNTYGANSRQLFERSFTQAAMLANTLEVYQAAICRNNCPERKVSLLSARTN
ncbi:MAG: glycosyltransferase family 4 protein [Pirellulaceae bacterium]